MQRFARLVEACAPTIGRLGHRGVEDLSLLEQRFAEQVGAGDHAGEQQSHGVSLV